jgi:RND superfamily putative drug exporter
MTLLLYRLGRASVRLRRYVLLGWVLAAIGIIFIGAAAGGETSDALKIPGTEAQQAVDVLEQRFPSVSGTSAQAVFAVDSGTLSDPNHAAAIDAALADIAGQPDVSSVGPLQRSADDRIGYADVQYSRPVADIKADAFPRLEETGETASVDGLRVEFGGELPSEATSEPPGGQEIFGLVAAVIVLLFAFGSVIAMGLPIGTALLGLATSIGLITIISAIMDVNSVAPVLAAMIGLGVGIDYALFIVTRHRENLHLGMTVEEAAGRSIATSGSSVVFAGMTVVIALAGLAIAGIPAVTVMGLMCSLTVAVMVLISLTLLPALLGFAGHKIDSIKLPAMRRRSKQASSIERETMWHRWGRHVSARPWTYLIGGLVVLGTLAAPLFSLRLGMTDNGTASKSLTTRQSYDLLAEGFGPGFNGPLVLSLELDGTTTVDDLGALSAAIAADPGVQSVAPPLGSPDGTAAIIQVIPTSSPQDEATTQLVHRLRNDVIPAGLSTTDGVHAYVGGQTATFIDLSDKVSSRLPYFIGAVIFLSVLLLMMVFRSIAVPLKAAAMNLLSIGAAYGVIVAVFQWGWLKGLFGVEETVPIISFLPMMLFAILFGLSMDYEVFLLSRVREEYLHHSDNTQAVIEGIAATARVITSAALIMISVFAAFILGDDPAIKMFGLGLAVAVFVDATIVRIVLVPATMRLLGDRNWWLPGWLDRILPRVDVEGGTGLPAPEYLPGRGPAPVPEPDLEPALA